MKEIWNSNLDNSGHFLFHEFLCRVISLKDDLIAYMCFIFDQFGHLCFEDFVVEQG